MSKEKKYLIKWQSDTNDADYEYGVEVVSEYEMKKVLEQKSI